MQNDLKSINVLLGVLSIALGCSMGRDETLIFEKADFRVGEIGVCASKQIDDLADTEIVALGQDYSPVSMRSGVLS